MVISPPSGVLHAKPSKSNIYQHYLQTRHEVLTSSFKIVFFSDREWETKLAESIHLHQFKPSINDMVSSTPLNIL